jgi:hypothetical protein
LDQGLLFLIFNINQSMVLIIYLLILSFHYIVVCLRNIYYSDSDTLLYSCLLIYLYILIYCILVQNEYFFINEFGLQLLIFFILMMSQVRFDLLICFILHIGNLHIHQGIFYDIVDNNVPILRINISPLMKLDFNYWYSFLPWCIKYDLTF